MRMNHTAAILLRQYYLMRGSVARLLPLFAWVAVDILLWGFITRYLNAVTQATFNFVPILLGAVLLWDFFTRVMQGVTTSFLEDVWSRSFLNLFATPLTIGEYIAGLVLTSVATSLIGLIVMLVMATTIFGLSYFSFGLMLIPFVLILFLFGIALGIASAAMVLRLGPASEWFVWPIPAMISPFVGVFYPLATLPAWMQYIAYALPPSYVFEGMRAILSGKPIAVGMLSWGITLATAYIVLAGAFFVRVYRYAVRTGLLARYSAESAN
jgi:ABC-2 type transport system permease protein